ncbi:MAG: LegC family aminotransferase [Proteobacteria bacterium]|nr:LegC family aminotransferase [Pseudomonadota bacterium]MBU1585820.1 LegC family aminotransferase [Pseudomonadota bacterium]MBU2453699.1 LegC family aminotransferase [Pseudomonadota bacterium]MBU2628352.1 LegC family aminotransferase [Pseudomonadota bacterium]
MKKIVDEIINTLLGILSPDDVIPLHEPFFYGNEKKYINDCIDTRFVSSIGAYVTQFETLLAEFTGAKHVIATVNGTSALHISLLMAGVRQGDEVLVPALTFVATANAVTYCTATPHFIDSNPVTLGIDVEKLDHYLQQNTRMENNICINTTTLRPIRAIVPVHIFGTPVDMDPLMKICNKFHLTLIEDAAESLGSYYKGTHTGTFGLCGALSFNGNKTITTGGGGAILCNNEKIALQAKHLTTTARLNNNFHYVHDQTGFNYRMPNINAAIGCAQIEQLPYFLKKKRKLAFKYINAFEPVKGVAIINEPDYAKNNFWLNTLMLDKPDNKLLQTILERTNRMGIQTRPIWTLLHKLPMYKRCPSMELSCALELEDRVINIPSSINLVD